MIYQKIKKKEKCIFRTTREFICLNLFRPHSVFFPPKNITYLCYVFPPLKNNISMPHFFFVLLHVIFFFLLLYLLSLNSDPSFRRKKLANSEMRFFFSRVDGLVQKRKKKKRKGENRKQKKEKGKQKKPTM